MGLGTPNMMGLMVSHYFVDRCSAVPNIWLGPPPAVRTGSHSVTPPVTTSKKATTRGSLKGRRRNIGQQVPIGHNKAHYPKISSGMDAGPTFKEMIPWRTPAQKEEIVNN
jgi:hypothetical protein